MTKLITYGDLELTVTARYVDTSYSHEMGTYYQGYHEIVEIKYNGCIIPLALVSEDTLDWIETEVNK